MTLCRLSRPGLLAYAALAENTEETADRRQPLLQPFSTMDSITNGWETLEFPSIDRLSRYRIVDRSINIVTNTPWAAMIEIPFRLEVIMGRKSGRAAPTLSDEQRSKLSGSAASRTAPVREVERAKVLLKYVQGLSISEI